MGKIIKDESKYSPPPQDNPWIKFEEGTTTIRLLSHSYHFKSHYVKAENKSYDCTGFVETCRWCQGANAPRQRWAYAVLVRGEEPVVKIMEAGWSIFKTILNLSKDEDYGDIRGYDLKITKEGTGLDTSYTVIPGKETDFTEEEMKLLEPKDLSNVEKATNYLASFYKQEEVDTPKKEKVEEDIPF